MEIRGIADPNLLFLLRETSQQLDETIQAMRARAREVEPFSDVMYCEDCARVGRRCPGEYDVRECKEDGYRVEAIRG